MSCTGNVVYVTCVQINIKRIFYFAGRLSKEEIEKMVKDAEKYKDEDDKQRERLQAKNTLESYAFSTKTAVEEENLQNKISPEDKQTVLDRCSEVIRWIDNNQVLCLENSKIFLSFCFLLLFKI